VYSNLYCVQAMVDSNEHILAASHQVCGVADCPNRFGSCDSYAGSGCPTRKCTYSSCSMGLNNNVMDCTWTCSAAQPSGSLQPLLPCDPGTFCGDCNSLRGSQCASGKCTWSKCLVDLTAGNPQCTHTCTAVTTTTTTSVTAKPPSPPPRPPSSPPPAGIMTFGATLSRYLAQ
jgi:hypothetical protein